MKKSIMLFIIIMIFPMGAIFAENPEPIQEVSFFTEKAQVLEVGPLIEIRGEYY